MNDENQIGQVHWQTRSAAWTATAPQGLSTDDTFSRMIIEGADIRPGERVLDLASGTGDPALNIALALDGNGSVTACDLTPAMLAKARERSVNVGVPAIAFVAADMTALPFADDSFDCITCRFGLMFPADRVAAAREALRVLRPGGRVAYVVWGPYEENPSFVALRRVVAAVFGEEEGPMPQRHSLGAPGLLTEILDAAGFVDIEERELRYRRPVADLDDYIGRALRRRFMEKLDTLDADVHADLVERLREAFAPYREGGVVQMPTCARLGLGRKP